MTRFALLLPLGLAAVVTACAPDATTPGAGGGAARIPEALQGRWGLTAAECTADPAIAKGLMTIDATTLRFYESRGRIAEVKAASETGLAGRFDYSGEGMTWQRSEVLELRQEGRELVRRATGEGAPTGPQRYVACDD